jgi:predicted DNA-binding protein (UPF0251 family)
MTPRDAETEPMRYDSGTPAGRTRRWCPLHFPTMKTILTTDWAPHAEAIARRLAQVCTVVYVAGYISGAWLHRLNDQLAGRPAPAPAPVLAAFQPTIVQRQAAAVATPSNIAPPVLVHISDPMARAVRLVHEGKSQRLAASLCGVSRSSLQRALKA